MDSQKLDLKRKSKRRSAWRRYEAEKKALVARGLSNAEYERAIRQLARRRKL